MTAARLPIGGSAIDRSRALAFSFDGRRVAGFEGDTIASALMAADIAVVGRSFKYHRPRGIWGAGVEEPNALVDVRFGNKATPNARATTEPAREALEARSVNASPTASADRGAIIDRFARFIPAAFYYKTFMWPDWHLFEPRIRAMAGLGRVDPEAVDRAMADQRHHRCDLLVVGAGPAGLAAARAGLDAGLSVTLVDERPKLGGSLLHRAGEMDGMPGEAWAASTAAALEAGGATLLVSTTAFGLYDHGLVGLNQRHPDNRPDTLWRVRPRRTVLATGAIERPLPFGHNDLPGIMSADAMLRFLRLHAVRAGENIVVATNNDSAYEAAAALAQAGANVSLVDNRRDGRPAPPAGVRVLPGRTVACAGGKGRVGHAILDDGSRIEADAVAVSGGWSPTLHLFCQAKGKLEWSEERLAFLPGPMPAGLAVAGAAAGTVRLSDALAAGAQSASGTRPSRVPQSTGPEATAGIAALWPAPGRKERVWIDLQNDVTAKDIELAARENFRSVEHLKRYTTLGMATDQGKTSNVPGLALMAQLSGRTIPETGTTTFRPPFTPVPFSSLAGSRAGELMAPVRRLPLETVHRAEGVVFGEYGGWLRPAFHARGEAETAIALEARLAREGVALFDGSPLGKIEVMGPRAAEFLDFIFYNTVSTLKPGRCRYGFMLSENGVVFDDGVLMRLSEHRFVVSCSTSHVGAVHARLEEWRQDRFGRDSVFIHDATPDLATVAVSGPAARELCGELDLGLDLDDGALPHMAVAEGSFEGASLRVARVSFTGDRSYEISVGAEKAPLLWQTLRERGGRLGAVAIGIEALMILRAEKGYIVIGKDTDGTTMPHDLGLSAPRDKRSGEFVGRRSLFTEVASREGRAQLVGLAVAEGEPPLETGAHAIETAGGSVRSAGFVTSSYLSPTLGRPIALGLIEGGASRHGETVEISHLGKRRRATLTAPCAFDPAGDRLHA